MNKKQKIALWFGVGLFVVMGIVPPWCLEETPLGYAFLAAPPTWLRQTPRGRIKTRAGMRVDTERLAIQWVLVGVLTGAAIFSLRNGAKTDTWRQRGPTSRSEQESRGEDQ